MTRQSMVSHRIQHIRKSDITAIIAGIGWMLFAGTILLTAYRNDDLVIIKGYFDFRILSEISLFLWVLMGLSLLLSPINRRFFGVVATVLACFRVGLMVRNYLTIPVLHGSWFSFLFGVFLAFLFLAPPLHVLVTAFARSPTVQEG